MATLNNEQRASLSKKLMDRFSVSREPTSLLKVDFRAAINAADTWIDTNATSFNLALPSEVRTKLSAKAKLELLKLVADERFEVN